MVIHSSALSAPITRGRRTVPPKPGMMPSLVSAGPILALVSARRKSVERMVRSRRPGRGPLMAERVGTGRSSMALKMSLAFFQPAEQIFLRQIEQFQEFGDVGADDESVFAGGEDQTLQIGLLL